MLAIRVHVASVRLGSYVKALDFLSHFFTILTNLVVMLLMGYIGMNRNRASAGEQQQQHIPVSAPLLLTMVTSILIVGLVYHAILSHLLIHLTTLSVIGDQGVHTVTPFLCLVWWCKYEDRRLTYWPTVLYTLPWPLLYAIYVLARAVLLDDIYPYPFLNWEKLGSTMLALNVVGLGVFFLMMSSFLVRVNHQLVPPTTKSKAA